MSYFSGRKDSQMNNIINMENKKQNYKYKISMKL